MKKQLQTKHIRLIPQHLGRKTGEISFMAVMSQLINFGFEPQDVDSMTADGANFRRTMGEKSRVIPSVFDENKSKGEEKTIAGIYARSFGRFYEHWCSSHKEDKVAGRGLLKIGNRSGGGVGGGDVGDGDMESEDIGEELRGLMEGDKDRTANDGEFLRQWGSATNSLTAKMDLAQHNRIRLKAIGKMLGAETEPSGSLKMQNIKFNGMRCLVR